MTRKKVKLVWITSDNARKASFKKRRLGLMKKVSELTTLCGVYAFAVVYGPDDDHPVVWPSIAAAQHLYRRFHSLPEVERQKKMMNQETYLKERTAKAQDMLKKHMKKNQELEIDLLMHQLRQGRQIYQLSTAELLGLFWMIEEKMRECRKRIDYHQQVHRLHPPPPPPPAAGFVNSNSPLLQTGSSDLDLVDCGKNLMDQWFIDMVMNTSDKIGGGGGGGGSSIAVELGFQSEANGGVNSMIEIGDLGGRGAINENNLLSDWNFVGTGTGMSEIEKLVSNINGGGGGGSDEEHMNLYSDGGHGGGRGSIGGNDVMLHGLFGGGSSNEDEKVNEDDDDEDDDELLGKEWQNSFTP